MEEDMQEFDLSEKVLEDIIVNGTQFNEALRKVFQADVNIRPMRTFVAGIVGCELRHHLLFEYLLKNYRDLLPEEKRALYLAFANLCFYKHITKEETIAILNKKVDPARLEEVKPLIEKLSGDSPFIPEDISKQSNRYLSLRFNTPEWVLKIFEHFGYGVTYKILKKNNRPFVSHVRVRTSVKSPENVIKEYPEFKKTNYDGILTFEGKSSLRKNPLCREGIIFKEKPITKEIIDTYSIEEPNELFIYNANQDSSILKEVVEHYGSSIGINMGVPALEKYADVTRLIRQKELKNVNFFGSSLDSLLVSISRPQDLVIAAPDSSNFDLIREQPDYLLHFDKGGMDELFAKEKETLEACSKFVAEDGLLIYIIYTISKKEGHQTVLDFLANHPEFKFIKEEQRFPFEEGETSVYYAVMKKDSNSATITTPINMIIGQEKTTTSNAAFADKE